MYSPNSDLVSTCQTVMTSRNMKPWRWKCGGSMKDKRWVNTINILYIIIMHTIKIFDINNYNTHCKIEGAKTGAAAEGRPSIL